MIEMSGWTFITLMMGIVALVINLSIRGYIVDRNRDMIAILNAQAAFIPEEGE